MISSKEVLGSILTLQLVAMYTTACDQGGFSGKKNQAVSQTDPAGDDVEEPVAVSGSYLACYSSSSEKSQKEFTIGCRMENNLGFKESSFKDSSSISLQPLNESKSSINAETKILSAHPLFHWLITTQSTTQRAKYILGKLLSGKDDNQNTQSIILIRELSTLVTPKSVAPILSQNFKGVQGIITISKSAVNKSASENDDLCLTTETISGKTKAVMGSCPLFSDTIVESLNDGSTKRIVNFRALGSVPPMPIFAEPFRNKEEPKVTNYQLITASDECLTPSANSDGFLATIFNDLPSTDKEWEYSSCLTNDSDYSMRRQIFIFNQVDTTHFRFQSNSQRTSSLIDGEQELCIAISLTTTPAGNYPILTTKCDNAGEKERMSFKLREY